MIRYPDALEGIEAEIGASWLQKARERTSQFEMLGKYTEEYTDNQGIKQKLQPFWSAIKSIYVKRQHGKCIYCESQIERDDHSLVQWDLEHFRPKGNVRVWPPDEPSLILKYGHLSTGSAAPGYYMLAYAPANYAAACKTCNSIHKSDYFPIAGNRIQAGSDPASYAAEDAYLIYPIGSNDIDPSDLITFDGAKAVPKYGKTEDAAKHLRANIIIDFFELNREWLERQRAKWLCMTVWPWIKLADNADPDALLYLRYGKTQPCPYANCTACFIDLCTTNRVEAQAKVKLMKDFLELTR